MKIIKKDNFKFTVDIDKTEKYYKTHSLCDCLGCKNLYKQINGKYPILEKFLSEYGVDITKPDETSWIDNDYDIEYSLFYTVTGNMTPDSQYVTYADNLKITVDTGYIPNEQTEDYFLISVYNINLPSILKETL